MLNGIAILWSLKRSWRKVWWEWFVSNVFVVFLQFCQIAWELFKYLNQIIVKAIHLYCHIITIALSSSILCMWSKRLYETLVKSVPQCYTLYYVTRNFMIFHTTKIVKRNYSYSKSFQMRHLQIFANRTFHRSH